MPIQISERENKAGEALTWITSIIGFIVIWANLGVFKKFIHASIALTSAVTIIVVVGFCVIRIIIEPKDWWFFLIMIPVGLILSANAAVMLGYFVPLGLLPALIFFISGFLFGYLRFENTKESAIEKKNEA